MYDSHAQYAFAKAKIPNVKFGSSKREFMGGNAVDMPGPGNYNTDRKA
jgi:hypothetical protein